MIEFLERMVKLIWGEDKALGIPVIVGLIAIFTTLIILQTGIPNDGLGPTMRFVGFAIFISAIAVGAIRAFNSSIYGHVIITFLLAIVMIFTACFTAQFLRGNEIGFLPRASCFYHWSARGCPLSEDYTDNDIQASVSEEIVQTVPPLSPLQFVGKVYVQFAGAIKRESVIAASTVLKGNGWNMQRVDRGGERTGVAAGLNEVRYFREEDRTAAIQLAQEFSETADWVSPEQFRVRNLSNAGYDPAPGTLEIWSSVN